MSVSPAVVVIGIDGADWQIIEQFRHRLPNLDSLIRTGTSGYLTSYLPYVTFPAWKCYSTGMNPDKLGVYGWEKVDFVHGTTRPVISTDFRGREIWDIAGAAGRSCCVLNMPSTYPIKPINGVLLAGPPVISTDDLSKVVYPPEMIDRVKAFLFYPSASWVAEKDKLFREVKQIIGEKCDLAVSLLREGHWDFFQFTFFLNDPIQHLFWDSDGEGLPMSMLGELWEYIDTYIGKMLDLAPPEATIMVVSDHGFAPLKGVLHINDWLEQEGYLHIRQTPAMMFQRLVPAKCIHKAIRAAQWLNLAGVILSLWPKSLRSKIVPNPFGWPLESSQIDWDKSMAVGSYEGPIYLNRKMGEEQYRSIKAELTAKLKNVKDPGSGEPIIEAIHEGSLLYPNDPNAPDLMLEPREGFEISTQFGSSSHSLEDPRLWLAKHRRDGTFIAGGDFVKSGNVISGARITDIAPTVVHILGLPVLKSMDGKVLTEIFKDGSEPLSRAIEVQIAQEEEIAQQPALSEGEEELLTDRLRGLGYL